VSDRSSRKAKRRLPVGEGVVPDRAMEELLAAFANDPPSDAPPIDLDDPSIDALLGLAESPKPEGDQSAGAAALPTVEQPVTEPPVAEPAGEPVAEPASPPKAGPQRTTIKIGGDDELPDALYLDEEAGDRLRGGERATEASLHPPGDDGSRTTILIADDDMEGAAGGIPIGTGPASMDPRLRARRIAVKRAVGRRRLKWFVIGGLVIIVLTAVLAVLGSSLFAVKNVEISGPRRMSQVDLDAAVKRIKNHPVLLIDTHSIEAQLERSPWVLEARVTTHFPHSATVEGSYGTGVAGTHVHDELRALHEAW